MKVSIVTPSYNQGAFLDDTIASVLAQDSPADEFIIVDGGSTDKTGEVLARRRSSVSRIIAEPDRGQADAVNKGVALAHGDVIGWLNSDDCYFPWTIQTVQEAFKDNPNASVVYGDYVKIDRDNRVLALRRQPSFTFSIALNGYLTVMQPAAFFKRKAFNECGGLDTSLRYAMDYDLWLKLAKLGPLVHVRKYLAAFRVHDNSKSVAERMNFKEENRRVQAKHHARHAEWIMLMLARLYQIRAAARLAREGCWGSRFGRDEEPYFRIAIRERQDVSTLWANR